MEGPTETNGQITMPRRKKAKGGYQMYCWFINGHYFCLKMLNISTSEGGRWGGFSCRRRAGRPSWCASAICMSECGRRCAGRRRCTARSRPDWWCCWCSTGSRRNSTIRTRNNRPCRTAPGPWAASAHCTASTSKWKPTKWPTAFWPLCVPDASPDSFSWVSCCCWLFWPLPQQQPPPKGCRPSHWVAGLADGRPNGWPPSRTPFEGRRSSRTMDFQLPTVRQGPVDVGRPVCHPSRNCRDRATIRPHLPCRFRWIACSGRWAATGRRACNYAAPRGWPGGSSVWLCATASDWVWPATSVCWATGRWASGDWSRTINCWTIRCSGPTVNRCPDALPDSGCWCRPTRYLRLDGCGCNRRRAVRYRPGRTAIGRPADWVLRRPTMCWPSNGAPTMRRPLECWLVSSGWILCAQVCQLIRRPEGGSKWWKPNRPNETVWLDPVRRRWCRWDRAAEKRPAPAVYRSSSGRPGSNSWTPPASGAGCRGPSIADRWQRRPFCIGSASTSKDRGWCSSTCREKSTKRWASRWTPEWWPGWIRRCRIRHRCRILSSTGRLASSASAAGVGSCCANSAATSTSATSVANTPSWSTSQSAIHRKKHFIHSSSQLDLCYGFRNQVEKTGTKKTYVVSTVRSG